jgi:hypothetical protein
MGAHYVYKKPVKRSRYSTFRRYVFGVLLLVAGAGAVVFFIYLSLHRPQKNTITSAVQNTTISGTQITTISDYFQFQDSGQWVLDKNNSTANKLTYHKFRKNVLEDELVVYINQVPIPLYLATPRVLPVRIVNNNSLQATNVSSPCVDQYAKNELHKEKEVSINGATMLCDPEAPDYYIVLSEINGNYQLHLKRPNGTPMQFVVTFKNLDLSQQPDTVMNIAGSFQTK